MNKLLENIIRFNQLYQYNPKKGSINESVDTTGWICVGEVPFYPWEGDGKKTYIMVNPQKRMKWGQEINDVIYTENNDGTGKQTEHIPTYIKDEVIIYPEHENDEFGEMFLGKKKDSKLIEEKHNNFISKLFINGNKVIIHHNSSYEIKDGMVRKGTPNGWSNNTDIGIYFWGSRNGGNDPSNVSTYTYYCIIELDDLYDFETNTERLSLTQALRKHWYVGQFWKKTDIVVINTQQPTPIWCILDKTNGKWYNKNWEEIDKPF